MHRRCRNEWIRGVCEKPRVKCGECPNQAFLPVEDKIILDHLQGRHVVGVYPLLTDETCWFLAADFDKAAWTDDVAAFTETCRAHGLPDAGGGERVSAAKWALIENSVDVDSRSTRALRRGGRSALVVCFDRAVRRGRRRDMNDELNHDRWFGGEHDHRGVCRRSVGGRIRPPALGCCVLVAKMMNGVMSGVDRKRDQKDCERRRRHPSPMTDDRVTAHKTPLRML
jgi:hypothetical protein